MTTAHPITPDDPPQFPCWLWNERSEMWSFHEKPLVSAQAWLLTTYTHWHSDQPAAPAPLCVRCGKTLNPLESCSCKPEREPEPCGGRCGDPHCNLDVEGNLLPAPSPVSEAQAERDGWPVRKDGTTFPEAVEKTCEKFGMPANDNPQIATVEVESEPKEISQRALMGCHPAPAPTPRTDAFDKAQGIFYKYGNAIAFARQLERELAATKDAEETIKELLDSHDYHEQRIATLERELAEARQEIHDLIWNLAGCSSVAEGACKPFDYNKGLARPALNDVSKLAAERDQLRAELATTKNEFADAVVEWTKAQKLAEDRLAGYTDLQRQFVAETNRTSTLQAALAAARADSERLKELLISAQKWLRSIDERRDEIPGWFRHDADPRPLIKAIDAARKETTP